MCTRRYQRDDIPMQIDQYGGGGFIASNKPATSIIIHVSRLLFFGRNLLFHAGLFTRRRTAEKAFVVAQARRS